MSSSSHHHHSWEAATQSLLRRQLDHTNDHNGNSRYDNDENDPYEFVAFLLWYVFLVLCCIVPTCCAYRRRRLIERRMAEQQQNMAQFQQANLFFLQGGAGAGQRPSEEALQQERFHWLTDALKPTTLTLSEANLKEVDPSTRDQQPKAWEKGRVVSMHGGPEGDYNESEENNIDVGVEEKKDNHTGDPPGQTVEEVRADQELADAEAAVALADMEEANLILVLPKKTEQSTATTTSSISKSDPEPLTESSETRELAGNCAICLCPYEVGEQVTWAAAGMDCQQHAFHTECIIPWLSKKEEPKCPVCRQSYGPPLPASSLPAAMEQAPGTGEGVPFPFSRSLAETLVRERYGTEPTTTTGPPPPGTLSTTTTTLNAQGQILDVTTSTSTPIAVATTTRQVVVDASSQDDIDNHDPTNITTAPPSTTE